MGDAAIKSSPANGYSEFKPTISAALIVRNEDKFLEDCLASLIGHVDEIVVVDTGSTDTTIAIAESHQVKLLHHRWTGDFSVARNAALDAATGDWILYIDADERLRVPPGKELSGLVHGKQAAAACVRFMPKSGFTRYREPRLFLNRQDIRFRGSIHETVMPDIERVCSDFGFSIIMTEAMIDHLGYDGNQDHKHLRNLPLLMAEVASTSARAYYYYHLAETLTALGRNEDAIRVGRQGIDVARRNDGGKNRADASLIYQTLARLSPPGLETLQLIEEGLQRVPYDHALRFLLACQLSRLNRHAEALPHLKILQEVDPDKLGDGLLAFDRRIFNTFAWQLTGTCFMAIGDRTGAVRAFHAAATTC
jgi:glycosyltransferase involved in cell wall biosynthesis